MTVTENVKIKIGWNLDNSYARLPETFFSLQKPVSVSSPKLVILNESLATSLGLDAEALASEDGVSILAGNKTPDGASPLAQAYAGHQFGHFTMLGDGRAVLIGEQVNPNDQRCDLQLKGSGRTPYSRGGDGRAALGPMLREYIISEAMYALGVPTTRSLAVVTTGESVYRETPLPGAILTRVAASHLRVGTFQYAAHWGTKEELRALADYAITRHFPEAKKSDNPYLAFLMEVIKQQASLIAKWQLVGFVHGVMNTDNMTISGETIDYGPCAFMDSYDPATVFSSIDIQGRYAYSNQPPIAIWNLARLAEALLTLLHDEQKEAIKLAEKAISKFYDLFKSHWLSGLRAKLGIFNEETNDEFLIEVLLGLMEKYKVDYTNTFRALTFDLCDLDALKSDEFDQWHKLWQARLERQPQSRDAAVQLMKNNNPALIPRNHRVEEALKAAEQENDYSVMHRLLAVLANPFEHSANQAEYATPTEPSRTPYRTFCGT